MNDLPKLFDPYERQARLFPAVLMLVPVLLVVAFVYPSSLLGEFPKNAIVAVVILALAYALAGFARTAGKSVEAKLYAEWGGAPTTVMLRHRDATLDPMTKIRYHTALIRMTTGIPWPSADDEAADPTTADAAYASAVGVLRARRRGDDYRLLLAENATYGFRRNVYGLRTTAIIVALLAGAVAAIPLIAQLRGASSFVGSPLKVANEPRDAVLIIADIAIASIWFGLVRRQWVFQAAREYARTLLNSIDAEGSV